MWRKYLICAALLLVIVACHKSPTNSTYLYKSGGTPLDLPEIINVIWGLEEYEISGNYGIATAFESFTFIISDSTYFGYDGYNWYGGKYVAMDSLITLYYLTTTEIACNLTVFPSNHLLGEFQLEITTEYLSLFNDEKKILFTSKTTNDVKESALVGKTWKVINSNAPEFELLNSQELLPSIEFGQDRTFRIEWYQSATNIFGENVCAGYFGLGDDGAIKFWEGSGNYSHPPVLEGTEDEAFVNSIVNCISYAINSNVLSLFEANSEVYFILCVK